MWPSLKALTDAGVLPCDLPQDHRERLHRFVCRAEFCNQFPDMQDSNANSVILLDLDGTAPLRPEQIQSLRPASAVILHKSASHSHGALFTGSDLFVLYCADDADLAGIAARCNEWILRCVSLSLSGERPPEEYRRLTALYFSSVFENALNGMRYSDSALDSAAQQAQMFPSNPYVLMIFQPQSPDPSAQNSCIQPLLECIDREAQRLPSGARLPVSVRNGSEIVCLFPNIDAVAAGIEDMACSFMQRIRTDCRFTVSTCQSALFPNINYTHSSYRAAQFSLMLHQEMYGPGKAVSTSDMSLYLYLARSIDFPSMTYVYDRFWGCLQEHDIANKTNLCQTLDGYVRCNGHSAEAADLLGVHRNTLRNRLHAVEKLLGSNLDDPETIFQISMAKKFKAIMKAGLQSGYLSYTENGLAAIRDASSESMTKEIHTAYEMLSRHDVSGETIAEMLRDLGLSNVSVRRVETGSSFTDFIRICIPGSAGKSKGMNAPTLGVVGRLSGIKLENQPLALISDADGAIAALALAIRLAPLSNTKSAPLGDVIISTQIALSSFSKIHEPAALATSAVDTETACRYEYDPDMDALLSITVCRATRWVNSNGLAVTPTVQYGLVLPPDEDLLNILETVSSCQPVVFPVTTYDITPESNGLYHVNSILQHAQIAACPVVGVALTSASLIPGVTLRHNDLADVELAVQFALEVAFSFTAGNIHLCNSHELKQALERYGYPSYYQGPRAQGIKRSI